MKIFKNNLFRIATKVFEVEPESKYTGIPLHKELLLLIKCLLDRSEYPFYL